MEIITRAQAGLPSPSGLSRKTTPWAGITWHHTGGGATTWKAIHDWQTSGRPAGDRLVYCGYSYGIGVDGRVTELRGWDYRAAGDHENSRLQVCFMGNWASRLPPQAALDAAREFARYAQQRAGKPMPGVAHRDVWSGGPYDTDCPGNALYAWVRANLYTIGDDDMEQSDQLTSPTAYGPRTVGNVLADLSNLRDWLYAVPGAKVVNGPPAGSHADLLVKAAQRPAADVDEAALAAALAPLIHAGATAEELAAAAARTLRAELDKTKLVGS